MIWRERATIPQQPSIRSHETEQGAHFTKTLFTGSILILVLSSGGTIWAEAPVGALAGRITFTGASTPDQVLEVTRDAPFCGKTATIRTLAVNRETGGLEGAVVSLDAIPIPPNESPLPPVGLVNSHCALSPPIMAGQVGQQLEIRNDDPIMHNTHLTLETSTFLNVALVPAGRPVVKQFKKPGIYHVKCDAHKFMKAAVIVLSHPFFSVTDRTGAFRISHLPPGDHVVTIWHEVLGTYRQRITIPLHGDANVTIEYPANTGSHDK